MDIPTADSGETDLSPRAPVNERSGRVIDGKFTLVREIGRGATGVVYEARNEWTRRRVALKIMHPGPSAVMRDRFVREARTAARVVHPNIVGVFELGEDDEGSLYIVEDLLDGASLEAHFGAHGVLSLEGALDIFIPIADALSVAHEQRVVHRDVKPSNIVLARGEHGMQVPMLVDFGLAKDVSDTGLLEGPSEAGRVLGTPHYMAPEQITDPTNVDARADVWALALCLFEALTGQLPFRSVAVHELFKEIVTFDLSRAPFVERLLPAVSAVLERALRVSPADRLSSMRELHGHLVRLALGDASEGETDQGKPTDTVRVLPNTRALLPMLRLGVVITSGSIERTPFVSAFRTALDRRVEVLRFGTYAALVDAVCDGEVELAWLPPVAYVRARRVADVVLLATCERAGGASYRSALLGRAGVVDDISQARGKRAVWVDAWSAAGYLLPRALLASAGIDPDVEMAAEGFLESYDGVLDALRAGTADVGATYCRLDANGAPVGPFRASDGVVVLGVSAPIPGDTLCATSLVSATEVIELRERLVANGPLLAGQFDADDLVSGDPERYAALQRSLFGGN